MRDRRDLITHSGNWLRVSLKRKRDVKKRCGVGAQERFEGCEKIEHYAIFSDCLSGLQIMLA